MMIVAKSVKTPISNEKKRSRASNDIAIAQGKRRFRKLIHESDEEGKSILF